MPDESSQQKAERQARLSHAMGVMYLQDQVDKLGQAPPSRGLRQSKSVPTADLPHPTHTGRPKSRALTGPGPTLDPPPSAARTDDGASKIRLVDASVLIFALRSVHNWTRDRSTCVIIPLEAINTLDLLKKGDEPINLAARKATRWLEEKMSISTQEGDAMLTHPLPGIFPQKESFRLTPTQIEKARANTASSSSAESGDMFSAAEAPRYLRELLSACLFCQQAAGVEFKVAIAYPPSHIQEQLMEEKQGYLNRTDGRATEAWLDAYGIPVEVQETSKTWTGEKASSRFHAEAAIGSSEGEQRRKASPTPSVSSSTSSFKSEFSSSTGTSVFGSSSHKSPRHRNSAGRVGVRCMSTLSSGEEVEEPIIARPSSAASSNIQQEDWSQSSTRIVRHNPTDAGSESSGGAAVRSRKGTLHKTKSGAEKMEDYLRRLEATPGSREGSGTPTPATVGSGRPI